MRTWIQEGRVSGDSLVWREGWRDWQEARKVFPQLSGTRAVASEAPSPLLPAPLSPAPLIRHESKRSKAMQATIICVLLLLVLVLVAVFAWVVWPSSEQPEEPAAKSAATAMRFSAHGLSGQAGPFDAPFPESA